MIEEKRIIDLEIKFSYQEELLIQLNDVVTKQQTTIERLEKEILDLKRNVNANNSIGGVGSLKDEKPPHY